MKLGINEEKFKRFLDKKCSEEMFFSKVPLSMLDKQITVLCGVNGSGKTQSLELFKEYFIKNNIHYVKYTGHDDGEISKYVNSYNKNSYTYSRGLLASFMSEGERRKDLFELWQETYLKDILKSKDEYYVLLDEIDSGLSVDRIWNSIGGISKKSKIRQISNLLLQQISMK